MAFNSNPMTDEEVAALKALTHKLLEKIRDSINIVDFWENAFEVKRLKGELSDILLASNIEAIIDQCDHIVSEITALAKVRHNDLV